MKTAMELALARIELMKDINPDSIHWEMFKNDCIEKEKEQVMKSYKDHHDLGHIYGLDTEEYYNQTYNQNKEPMKLQGTCTLSQTFMPTYSNGTITLKLITKTNEH